MSKEVDYQSRVAGVIQRQREQALNQAAQFEAALMQMDEDWQVTRKEKHELEQKVAQLEAALADLQKTNKGLRHMIEKGQVPSQETAKELAS